MPEHFDIYMIILIGLVSILYASVGHGGASGYLAVMAIWALPTDYMKTTALILNIVVSGISFSQYYIKKYFNWKLFYPFALASIPFAYIGGGIHLDPVLYKKILGVILLLPVIRLSGIPIPIKKVKLELNIYIALLIGSVIGFLSGMLGIGGGIILSPIILLLGWGSAKQTAAVSALFILVNSLAGLLNNKGWSNIDKVLTYETYILLGVVVGGGILGAWWGSSKAQETWIKRLLAIGLGIASIKLIFA